jgi:hypothetical protein
MNNNDLVKILNKNLQNKLKKKKLDKQKNQYIKTKRIFNLKINRLDKLALKIKINPKIKLPQKVDLRNKFQPICNQGNLGSCTANALVAIVGYDIPTLFGSRLFLYYNERVLLNNVSQDTGAYLSDGILTLQKYGLCQETSWPYNISQFTVKPPESCYTEALDHIALTVQNIDNTLNEMQTSLALNEPFVVGIAVYSSFQTLLVARTGMVPMPSKKDTFLGGHAIVCVGYDNIKKLWIMRNSWGTSWGDKGYFYLPYNYLLNPNLASDLWIIQKMK